MNTPTTNVLQTYARLDAEIRDCDHSILIAERLKAAGLWKALWDDELGSVRESRANAIQRRENLDRALAQV